jgi:hypothetical protein
MRFIFVFMAFLPIFAATALAEDGSISGIVTSANNTAVPDAVVTLWAIVDGTPVLATVPNNPQYTSNFSSTLPGAYAFTGVPPGQYNVTAEWRGYWHYTAVNLTGGTATANIVIPAYINVTALSTPVPTPAFYYTYVPVEVSSPLPQATTRSPGFEIPVFMASILILALARKRP